ncbi:DUF2785 domain-containing protein [Falsibacillus pallidus]|uniref:DUF2785 domain-containing protein n=1 Tax=Falsibacillus pallidus TaxID=493781 RepID=UPI003D968B30
MTYEFQSLISKANELELKEFLKGLKHENLKSIKREDVKALIPVMLNEIGNVDPELRDNFIYSTFIQLLDEDILSPEQCRHILKTCLDEDHLFFNIGEVNTDSVFTRSFSSLFIAAIVFKSEVGGFLSKEEVEEVFRNSLAYMQREQDTRGYVSGKGWAHSMAHGADMLVSLAKHPEVNQESFSSILDMIADCLLKKDAVYVDNEDGRLINVIEALLDRGMDEKELDALVQNIFHNLSRTLNEKCKSIEYYRAKFNCTTFLKTLYFRLKFRKAESRVCDLILGRLKELHQRV